MFFVRMTELKKLTKCTKVVPILVPLRISQRQCDHRGVYELKRKSGMWKGKNAFLYIFSKNSFTERLLSMRRAEDRVKLFSLSGMIDSFKG